MMEEYICPNCGKVKPHKLYHYERDYETGEKELVHYEITCPTCNFLFDED